MVKLNLTYFLILITLVSKLIGFVREMMLLGNVGISAGLDLLVIFFSFTTFLTGVIGTCVVTNMTPLMANNTSEDAVPAFLTESIKVAAGIAILALLWNTAYMSIALGGHPESLLARQLTLLMAAALFFSIVAEYQVAIFLSQNRQVPVISGNILISLPLVIGMLLFDISILIYAIGLVLAFALRVVIFTILLHPAFPRDTHWWRAQLGKKPLLFQNATKVLQGGSAMLSVSFIFLVAMMLAERQSVGTATLIGYGQKIPLLVLTSIWFVLGARFFSKIVQQKGQGSHILIAKLTKFNILITALLTILVVSCIALTHLYSAQMAGTYLDFARIINASLPLLPIIVFIPIIEMTQRTLVTLDRHAMVVPITIACLTTALIGFAGSTVLWDSTLSIMLTITLSFGMGTLPAFLTLKKMQSTSPHD